eukprot:gb/GFBE01043789.1/.p1 GENE.gb/GFBE01043789.1/~~gb/GFBE01043789.1/.p1  ORF type:complete len:677 (+),score=179.48 gb/GFBE01043789.1/:1-2031(+)
MKLSVCALPLLFGLCADAGKTSSMLLKNMDIASLASAKLGAKPGSAAHQDITSPNMAAMAGPLLDLLKTDSGQDSNNTAVVQSISDILEDMKTSLRKADNQSRADIEAARQVFYDCLDIYKAADTIRFPGVAFAQVTAWYDEHFKSYQDCKTWEEELKVDLTRCDYFCLEEAKKIGENCTDISDDCALLDCSPLSSEGYRPYLERMIAEISAQIAVVESRGSSFNFNGTHSCTDIVETSQKCYESCDDVIKPIVPDENNIPGCCAPRTEAEDKKCQDLKDQRQAWTDYSECYDDALPNWYTVTEEEEAEGVSRAAQMRSVLRMDCLVNSFGDNQAAKLQACIDANYTQDPQVLAMKIDAGDPPPKFEEFQCNAAETPGSPEFEALHYGELPAGLIACPPLNCEDACGLSNTSLTYYNTTTPAPDHSNATEALCIKQLSTASAAYWDFGSQQTCGEIGANPSPGVYDIKVYLTDHGPESGVPLSDDDLCGTIYETSREITCSSKPAGRYLVMKATLQGDCVFGECVPAWCQMTVDSAAMAMDPQANTGSSFTGIIYDADHSIVLPPSTTTTPPLTAFSNYTLVGDYTTDIVEKGGKVSFLEECSKLLHPCECVDVSPAANDLGIELQVAAAQDSELSTATHTIQVGDLSLSGFGAFKGTQSTGEANVEDDDPTAMAR